MGKIFGWGVVWMLLLFAGGCSTGEERQLNIRLQTDRKPVITGRSLKRCWIIMLVTV